MEQITLERSIWIDAPRERVWQAVTDPDQLAKWFAIGTVMNLHDDGTVSIRLGDEDIDVATIEIVDPPRQLTSRSLPDRQVTTTYLLEEENGGTRMRVVMAGLESMPEDGRQAILDQHGAGWEGALANIKAYILGTELPFPQGF